MQITLPNGQVIEKVEPTQQNVVKIKTNTQLQQEDAEVRRKLSDLPDLSNVNIISQVLCYNLYGLSLQDISTVTKIPLENVQTIVMSQDFADYKKKMLASIKELDEGDVRNYLSKASKRAAEKVVDIMQNCANPKFSLAAAQDILDRSGQRPVDVVEHKMKVDNELRILYITKNDNEKKQLENIKPVDAEYEEV